jgi:hypothetical protein
MALPPRSLFVHSELELGGDESRNAPHHPFPGSSAANVDVAIVRIPYKPKLASLQLAIELVEHDVTEQGRQYAPYTKGIFQFERTVVGWRGKYTLLDLRCKW